ncbi:MAG: family 16 glycoside hydrolase [Bacteroidota bacterium]
MKTTRTVLGFLLMFTFSWACEQSSNTQNARLAPGWEDVSFGDWEKVVGGVLSSREYHDFLMEGEFFLTEGQQNQILFGLGEGEAFSEGGLRINLAYNPNQQNTLGSVVNEARAMVIENVSTRAWNQISLAVREEVVEVRINGQLVVATQTNAAKQGKIGFQAAQDLVSLEEQFRNFKIQSLAQDEKAEIFDHAMYRTIGQKNAQPILTENLEGWFQTGTGTWDLEEGVLTGLSGAEGGYLISDSLYKSLYLSTEFKIAKEDNSGIFVRLNPDSISNISVQGGIECNIYDHNGFTHAFSTGSIVAHARAFSQLIDYGDWNRLEILAINSELVLYVNGKESADHTFPAGMFEKAGHIALQAGIRIFDDKAPSQIQLRNIRLATLD